MLSNKKKLTHFELQVLNEIKKIPKGQVITYKELAIRIGRPTAYRAVANACGKNYDPINIPCHRVIRSDGKLGGYSLDGGSKMKARLINNEK